MNQLNSLVNIFDSVNIKYGNSLFLVDIVNISIWLLYTDVNDKLTTLVAKWYFHIVEYIMALPFKEGTFMLTSFGCYLRKLRIDTGYLLKDLASYLCVTSSYLSAVEMGKRRIPDDWAEIICQSLF